jgi:hypothetical protein
MAICDFLQRQVLVNTIHLASTHERESSPYSAEAPYPCPPMAVTNRKGTVELSKYIFPPDEVHVPVEWKRSKPRPRAAN